MAKLQELPTTFDNMTDLGANDIDNDDIVIDFDDIVIELIPGGSVVHATIIKAVKATSSTGNPMINLQFKIDNVYDLESKFLNTVIFDRWVVLPDNIRAMDRIKQGLIALGYPRHYKGKIIPSELEGLDCDLTLKISTSTQIDPKTNELYAPKNEVAKYTARVLD